MKPQASTPRWIASLDRVVAKLDKPLGRLCQRPKLKRLAPLAGLVIATQLQPTMSRRLGHPWGVTVSLLYAVLGGLVAWACIRWADDWGQRWHRSSESTRRMPGFDGLTRLLFIVALLAAAPFGFLLPHWQAVTAFWGILLYLFFVISTAQQKAGLDVLERLEIARDHSLRARLAPHFLFNALNSLKAQMAQDPQAASRTLDRLAELFRQLVQTADQPTVPLREELAFVEAYLGIEQTRLGNRLKIEIQVPEELEDVPVPPFSLQVLVENAVKHGVAPLESGGTVMIRAERSNGYLVLSVTDPGDGQGCGTPGTGTALETLRMRLACPGDLEIRRAEGHHRVMFRWKA